VAWHCPHCAARLEAASLEGTIACPWCGSVVYAVEGEGIPHKIVSSCRTEAEVRRAALDTFRRRGRACVPGAIRIVYVPYYIFEVADGGQEWRGEAAVGLPSAELMTIPVFGTDTRWFDPAGLPANARVMEASRTLDSIAEGRKVRELRHIPIAHVAYEEQGRTGSLWIDADRGRVIAGGPERTASAAGADAGLKRALWGSAGAACFCGLVLPPPVSLLAAGAAVFALALATAPARRRGARLES